MILAAFIGVSVRFPNRNSALDPYCYYVLQQMANGCSDSPENPSPKTMLGCSGCLSKMGSKSGVS